MKCWIYPDPLTPKSFPELLQNAMYDPFGLMPKRFPPHPHLLISPASLQRIQTLIRRKSWHAHAFLILRQKADTNKPNGPLSVKGPDPAWAQETVKSALRNAIVWVFTQKSRYRRQSIAHLHNLARVYPKWPVQPGLGRLGIEDSQEAQLIVRIAQTYDILAASPLSPRDHGLFRKLLESTKETSNSGAHRDCGNHNTAVLRGRLAAAVALHDRQGIHDVLYGWGNSLADWRYGLIHQLRHDLLDDGLHWERAPGYHAYSLSLFAEMADMLLPLGVDLWHKTLPPLWQNDGQDIHRDYGTRLGTKTLKSAFDALFFLAFPNGDLSGLNDSRLENLRGLFAWGPFLHRAYEAYQDPLYAALIRKAESEIPTDERPLPGLPLALQSPWIEEIEFLKIPRFDYPPLPFRLPRKVSFSLVGHHQNNATLFPVYGAAVLRTTSSPTTALSAFLFWGPHAAGHQSPASLHLDLHACGEKITDAPRMDNRGYADPHYLTWARTTIAHNTVTVDQSPMFPYDFETDSIWECDRWRDSISDGECLLFQPDGDGFQAVRARNERVYSGVCLDRTILVTPSMVLDVYRILSNQSHLYDWAMHGVGNPVDLQTPSTRASLGSRRGYRHFSNVRRLLCRSNLLRFGWKRATGQTALSLLAPPGSVFYLARDPLPPPGHGHTIGELAPVLPRHSLIARTKGRNALFIAAWVFNQPPPMIRLLHGNAGTDLRLQTALPKTKTSVWFLPFPPTPIQRFSPRGQTSTFNISEETSP